MDNLSVAKAILESYKEITVLKELQTGDFVISLRGKQFLFLIPDENDPASKASVYLYNDDGLDYPHIMLYERNISGVSDIPDGKYRWVCLYEHESVVNSLSSFVEKIIDAVDRLIELLSMNAVQQETEFQKEFMFYWNCSAANENDHHVYISNDEAFLEMDSYYDKKTVRLVERGLFLNDIGNRNKHGEREWVHHIEAAAYYIPISDYRGIIPPHTGFNWTSEEIRNIVYGKQINHINDDTFRLISSITSTTQNIIVVFGIKAFHAYFAVRVRFKNNAGGTLLDKLVNDVVKVDALYTHRKDYHYLCEQIGNDIGILNKKILLIGAGSLGSYVAFELAKNGASKIKIYDADKLEDANILRWAYAGFGIGANKADHISLLLRILHPEIQVESVSKDMDDKSLEKETKECDMIIVTVGNSDEQLKFNRVFEKKSCSIPVIYAWLEAGGASSHILVVDYQKTGCFECLYTDEAGTLVNNRANHYLQPMDDLIIHNGCGGTRATYGTATVLRTTAALLEIVNAIQNHEIEDSAIFDISPVAIGRSQIKFPMEACGCCGNRNQKQMCETDFT